MACKATFNALVECVRPAASRACAARCSAISRSCGLRHVALRPGEVGFSGLELGGGVVVALLERFEEFLRRLSVVFLTVDIRRHFFEYRHQLFEARLEGRL